MWTEKKGSPSEDTPAGSDCPVCFDPYGPQRPPKRLACGHAFCAVCLKLLVRHEASAGWRVRCPVCREATPVFGGLVCSLPTQDEALLVPWAGLGPNGQEASGPEGSKPPGAGISYIYRDRGPEGGPGGHENRGAARRLLFLLSLLTLLGLLVLPFVDRGLLKWALCLALGCGAVMSGVLCWNPARQCRCPLPSWRKRESRDPPAA